jgi:hypothetical protein
MRKSKYKFHLIKKGEFLNLGSVKLQNVRTSASAFGKDYGIIIIAEQKSDSVWIQRVR